VRRFKVKKEKTVEVGQVKQNLICR
jgi:hypothetical protein